MKNETKRIIDWCIWCKDPIYEGESYYIDKNEDKWHDFCRDQMKDNSELFGV